MNEKLEVEYLPLRSLIPYARNARTHSAEQIREIATSIRKFGWTNPVLIGDDNGIIAGHGRCLAAERIGVELVPCIRLKGLSDAQKRAYVLADNQLPLNAGWNDELLRMELTELKALNFDIKSIGFSDKDLRELFSKADEGKDEPENRADEDDAFGQAPERCKLGDMFMLGAHRLLCGDSTDEPTVRKLIGGTAVDMIFTDPPYGVKERTARATAGRGNLAKSYDFRPVLGDETTDTAIRAIMLMEKVLPNALAVYWGANYFAEALPPISSWLVWDKRDGVKGDDNADCELAWTNRGGPARLFAHLWKGAIKGSEHGERRIHPTQKPVALAVWTMTEFPKAEPRTILDLFGGSGSTLIACEKLGKTCLMLEMDPKYCDVIVARWEKYSGLKATRIPT